MKRIKLITLIVVVLISLIQTSEGFASSNITATGGYVSKLTIDFERTTNSWFGVECVINESGVYLVYGQAGKTNLSYLNYSLPCNNPYVFIINSSNFDFNFSDITRGNLSVLDKITGSGEDSGSNTFKKNESYLNINSVPYTNVDQTREYYLTKKNNPWYLIFSTKLSNKENFSVILPYISGQAFYFYFFCPSSQPTPPPPLPPIGGVGGATSPTPPELSLPEPKEKVEISQLPEKPSKPEMKPEKPVEKVSKKIEEGIKKITFPFRHLKHAPMKVKAGIVSSFGASFSFLILLLPPILFPSIRPDIVDDFNNSRKILSMLGRKVLLPPSGVAGRVTLPYGEISTPNREIARELHERFDIPLNSAQAISLAIENNGRVFLSDRKAYRLALRIGLEAYLI